MDMAPDAAVALQMASEYEAVRSRRHAIQAYGYYLSDMAAHVHEVGVRHTAYHAPQICTCFFKQAF